MVMSGYKSQSAEHLNVPTNANLQPTNQQVNNQPTKTSQSMNDPSTNQPDKIAGGSLDLSLVGSPG